MENESKGAAADATHAKELAGAGIADEREVLETLTRILRRAETEDSVQKLRCETRTVDADGAPLTERCEKLRIEPLRPRLADVLRAAELIGKYHGMFGERLEGSIALPLIICGEDELK